MGDIALGVASGDSAALAELPERTGVSIQSGMTNAQKRSAVKGAVLGLVNGQETQTVNTPTDTTPIQPVHKSEQGDSTSINTDPTEHTAQAQKVVE